MRSLFLLSLLIISFHIVLFAQQNAYQKFEWSSQPTIHKIDPKYQEEVAVFVSEMRRTEYANDKDGLFMFKTSHRIVHVNTDKGVESFNKVYLPFDEGLEMIDVKARTILPNGKIIELNKDNIKDYKDEEGRDYKIFALDGLVKGCEIEYYYTQKLYPVFFGRDVFSFRLPLLQADFELVCPQHLIFDCKSFNQFPNGKDTVIGEKRIIHITANNISAADDEKYSKYRPNLKRVEYKLSYNIGKNPQERLFTWNELAKKAFSIYSTVEDKESKKVDDVVSQIGINSSQTEKEKIIAVENYLKKNFIPREDAVGEDAFDLTKVIKNKVASYKGYNRLFCAIFDKLGVNYQLVLVASREDYPIDKTFENWNNTDHLIFYFPSTKKFLAPTEIELRYPWIPSDWAGTTGLFCKGTTIGDFKTAVAEIRTIPMEDYEKNYVNLDAVLDFSKDKDTVILTMKHIYGGYISSSYKAPFIFMPADQQKEVLKEMLKFGTNSENVVSSSFENKELELPDPYNPFIINAVIKSTELLEKAGDKVILKIGEVLGDQVEMYDEKPRQMPVELDFPHFLLRHIDFTIPEGYTIKNLKDVVFDQTYKENGEVVMGFVSSYTQDGNKVKITVREDYKKIYYPLEQYEEFKKIINTAADFNKVVLLMEKK